MLSWPRLIEKRSYFESVNMVKEQQLSFPEQCQWIQGFATSSWPPVGVRIDGARAINTEIAKSRFCSQVNNYTNYSIWPQPHVAQAELHLP